MVQVGISKDLKRQLSFRDVFFLSFGGSSPLLSLLTYGAVALSLGGYLAPVILLVGALVVLINGLVVQRLSKRFTSSGGYYTYAIHSLSERTGFQTGWMYLFYSILFGATYVIGAVYVINFVFGVSPLLIALAITLPAFAFLVLGIRPSAKYAVFAGMIEIGAMILFVVFSTYLSHFTFYSPITFPGATEISVGKFALAILFAMGIPTGYGSIAPLSGEIKNAEKVVGRTAVSVILLGGGLASLFVYSLTNLLVFRGVDIFTAASGGGLVVINLINSYFGSAGRYFTVVLAIATINDGILAILSFTAACSRTIFKMGLDRTLPRFFSKQLNGQPILANIIAGLGAILISLGVLIPSGPAIGFVALGTISVFGGLFIHLAANFSLMRIGIRRIRRKAILEASALKTVFSQYGEIALAVSAIVITALDLIFSMFSTAVIYSTLFLGWIVVGYLLSDIKEIVFKTPTSGTGTSNTLSQSSLWQRVGNLTAIEIRGELPDVVVDRDDSLRVALKECLRLDSPAAVVLDSKYRPAGTLILHDILELSEEELDAHNVDDYMLSRVATVKETEKPLALTETFRESGLPILAIVDGNGKFMGTIREREIIRKLASAQEGHFLDPIQDTNSE